MNALGGGGESHTLHMQADASFPAEFSLLEAETAATALDVHVEPRKKKQRKEGTGKRHHCHMIGEVFSSNGKPCDDNGGQGWADTGGLKRHVLAHTTEKKKYVCGRHLKDGVTICDFSTNHSATMYAHRKGGKHVDTDKFEFKCPHCNRQFPLRQGLDRHIKTHATDGEKPPKNRGALGAVSPEERAAAAAAALATAAMVGGGGAGGLQGGGTGGSGNLLPPSMAAGPLTSAVEGASALTAHITGVADGVRGRGAPDTNGHMHMPSVIDPTVITGRAGAGAAMATGGAASMMHMMDAVAGGEELGGEDVTRGGPSGLFPGERGAEGGGTGGDRDASDLFMVN